MKSPNAADDASAPPVCVHAALPSNMCSICSQCFGSSRALSMHMRTKHAQKSALRTYLDGSGRCPVCLTQFESRIRCLAHVSEKRFRGKAQESCRSKLEAGGFLALPHALVSALDAANALLRRGARRHGRSAPLVAAPASRSKVRAVPNSMLADSVVAGRSAKRSCASLNSPPTTVCKRMRLTHKHSLLERETCMFNKHRGLS